MDLDQIQRFVNQALALAYNYILTGRSNKAVELIVQTKKVDPSNPLGQKMMDYIFAIQQGTPPPDLSEDFGTHWLGQNLTGKSIQIFCDQGMGDTINLLRYLYELKRRWDCKIVLNCYAFWGHFERLLKMVPCVDEFVNFHLKCDYTTNIMSVPAILSGLQFDVYYPVHWKEVMECPIPEQPLLCQLQDCSRQPIRKVGVAWKSNADNPLAKVKSIDVELFKHFRRDGLQMFAMIPDIEHPDWILPYSGRDLLSTARSICCMDAIVSVDTVTLHLAGALRRPTFGLLPHDSDPRWPKAPESSTVWYPLVKMFHQPENLDWEVPILQAKEALELFLSML